MRTVTSGPWPPRPIPRRDAAPSGTERFKFTVMETTSCAVRIAFRTALLFVGATETAELAVIDGIDACENISLFVVC